MDTVRTYLDHNASTPLRPEAADALHAALSSANPSSVHAEGRRARAIVETARTEVAALVGASPGSVMLTGGGSEANATALRPGALLCLDGRPTERLLLGATEHASVLHGHRFGPVEAPIRVAATGLIDLDDLAARLRETTRPTLVSIQAANGETGVVQPLEDIAALVTTCGAALHVDAVQAAPHLPLAFDALRLTAMSIASHKLGGPPGAGALIVAPGRLGPEAALIAGGGQELGLRGGTENVPAIAGFGRACAIVRSQQKQEAERTQALRDAAEAMVRGLAPDAVVFGEGAPGLPNTFAFAVPGLKAETALMSLDLEGIAVSSGSACSSGKVGRSHVLAAMGLPEALVAGALRVSFGWNSTMRDVERFGAAFASVLQRLYDRRTPRAA